MVKAATKPATAPVEEEVGLADVIRAAFAQNPDWAYVRHDQKAFKSWVQEKMGDKFNESSFQSSKGKLMTTYREEHGMSETHPDSGSPTTTPKKSFTASSAPTLQDAVKVMTFLNEKKMTAGALLNLVEELGKLGTLDHVKATLGTLGTLVGLMKGK